MIRALYTAASGMSAQQLNLDTIANNLANSSTTGFRQLRLEFEDMVYQNMVTPGAAQSQSTVSAGLQVGLGTKSAATEVIMTQGSLNQTSNPLDVAIQGTGFFQVQRPDGTIAYTRAGQFQMNNQGTITTVDGDPIIPTITVPANAVPPVTITQYGVVNATLPGQQNPSQLGQLQLATFPNPGGLESMGGNLLKSTLSSGDPVLGNPGGTEGMGTLQQGYLENSNVDVVTEFVQMVLAQRAYESNSKVIKAADDMYSQVNNMTH
jgi:flagellar basal-body rod protein FlgG